jgi:hypothetical protein
MTPLRNRLLVVPALALASSLSVAAPLVTSTTAATALALQPTVTAFGIALGAPDNGNQGPQPTGHREINWDGGGATNGTAPVTPFTTFLNTRGGLFTTPGTGLQQSLVASGTNSLADINPTYATTFLPFSPNRVFTPDGAVPSNITDATFFLPGSNGGISAAVSGFGVVFNDVDLANTTSMQFFDPFGASLGTFFVPAAPGTANFSFLGVIFNAGERVGRVRITTGNAPLSGANNDGGGIDVVVMDDFLYSEPRAVPEPSTLLVLAMGLLALVGVRSRRA